MVKYVLGIDQGSSKTHALIGDVSGRAFGFGSARGACHSSVGIGEAMDAIRQAVDAALQQAGLQRQDIGVAFAGITGMDWPEEETLLQNAIRQVLNIPDIHIVNDCIIAMRGGTNKSYGAVLCAGSGLNCAILTPGGERYVYGFYIEDRYQGGSALGFAAVQAVFNAEAGLCPSTLLTKIVLDSLDCPSVDDLLRSRVAGKLNDRDYLKLPLLLEQAALSGDRCAKDILADFGGRWGDYLACGLEKMQLIDIDVDVVLSGSILKCKEPSLLSAVRKKVESRSARARLVDAKYEPVIGAYLMGVEKVAEISRQTEENIRATAEKYSLARH